MNRNGKRADPASAAQPFTRFIVKRKRPRVRFIFKQTANETLRVNQLTGAFVLLRELTQRGYHLQTDFFTLNEEPIIELLAIAE